MPDISPDLPSEYILPEDCVLFETEMKSVYNLNVMTGFPFGWMYTAWRLLPLFWIFFWWEVAFATVWVCLHVSSVAWWDEREMSHLWVCWQVPCTLTFPAVVLQWVARLTPLAHHKRGEYTDVYWKSKKTELNLNYLAPLPLWSFPSSV